MRKDLIVQGLFTTIEKASLMLLLASDFVLNGIFLTMVFLKFGNKLFAAFTLSVIGLSLTSFYAFLFWKYAEKTSTQNIILSSITSLASITEVICKRVFLCVEN